MKTKPLKITITLIFCILFAMSPYTSVFSSAEDEEVSDEIVFDLSEDKTFLYTNDQSRLRDISSIHNIQEVKLENVEISDQSIFKESSFKSITFKNCTFKNFTSSAFPDTLTSVCLDNTPVDDYSIFNKPLLKGFHIDNGKLDNFNCISSLNNLISLTVENSNISCINGLEKLTNLTRLILCYTGIDSINEIKALKKLTYLDISYTYVTDLSPLKGSNIESLYIANIPFFADISALTQLPKLTFLDDENCEIAMTKEILDYLKQKGVTNLIEYEDLNIRSQIEKIVSQIITKDMTDKDKILAVTKYVVNHLEYDYNDEGSANYSEKLNEYNYHSLKYALSGLGVCENYAAFETALLNYAGIECYRALGYSSNEHHIWNIVRLNDNYYYIDPTFIASIVEIDNADISDETIKNNWCYLIDINNKFFNEEHILKYMPCKVINHLDGVTTCVAQVFEDNTQSSKDTISKFGNDHSSIKKIAIIVILAVATSAIVAVIIIKNKKRKTTLD